MHSNSLRPLNKVIALVEKIVVLIPLVWSGASRNLRGNGRIHGGLVRLLLAFILLSFAIISSQNKVMINLFSQAKPVTYRVNINSVHNITNL